MEVYQMREKIKKVYPTETWHYKVNHMPDKQVMAIYFSMKESGKLDKPKKKAKETKETEEFKQMTIFNYI